MPCPFAPLLSIIPALPFLPWIIGKSMERLGKKNKIKFLVGESASQSKNLVQLENDQAFSLENPQSCIKTLEFYQSGAPYFRKTKAHLVLLASDSRSETLLFTKLEDSEIAKSLTAVFLKHPLSRVVFKDNRIIVKLINPECYTPEALDLLIGNLSLDIKAVL